MCRRVVHSVLSNLSQSRTKFKSPRGSSFIPAGLKVSLVTKPRTVIQQRETAVECYTVSGAKGSCETGLKDPPINLQTFLPHFSHPLMSIHLPALARKLVRLDLLHDAIRLSRISSIRRLFCICQLRILSLSPSPLQKCSVF